MNTQQPMSGQESGTPPSPADTPSLREAATGVIATSRRHLADLLELFTLEFRYSGLMLGRAVAMAVVAALALFSVWGLLMAALIVWMVDAGWNLPAGLFVLALVNAGLVVTSLWFVRGSLKNVGLNNTRQVLGLDTSNASE